MTAYVVVGHVTTRDGREHTDTITNLNGRPLTAAEADLLATLGTARHGCETVYRAVPAGSQS